MHAVPKVKKRLISPDYSSCWSLVLCCLKMKLVADIKAELDNFNRTSQQERLKAIPNNPEFVDLYAR